MTDLVLYDGACGLCSRLCQFILTRDRHDRFRFAALQGELAAELLRLHERDPARLDTVYVVSDYRGPAERLLAKSDAALAVAIALGGGWHAGGKLLRFLPRRLRDRCYDFVAARRRRWFGAAVVCPVRPASERAKFLDEV